MLGGRSTRVLRSAAPWLILGAVLGVAFWHVLDFSEITDPEFPQVIRPTYNRRPPLAYRLAEPGDTLDRISLYLAAGSVALSGLAIYFRARSRSNLALWPSALSLGLAATWYSSTPGPAFDGWHGLGWRVIRDDQSPVGLRIGLGLAAIGLMAVIAWNLRTARSFRPSVLMIVSAVLVGLRQFEIPGVEPVGYWPRVAIDLGFLGFVLSLILARPFAGSVGRVWPKLALSGTWATLVFLGISLTVYHRPLARLRPVVPGRIYISAMPTYRGLAIEQERLHFKTIINLFDEASSQASPRHAEEIRFVREHGLRYLGSPSDGLSSDKFLNETLALAQDPDAWPILVHCHGCMDRSPAWMGIYRFLVQGVPLNAVFAEIERHRGSKPKAIVSLQYDRKLPARAPDRYAADPVSKTLRRSSAITPDPFLDLETARNPRAKEVVTRIDPEPPTRRP